VGLFEEISVKLTTTGEQPAVMFEVKLATGRWAKTMHGSTQPSIISMKNFCLITYTALASTKEIFPRKFFWIFSCGKAYKNMFFSYST
jgi:hypothetical protein